jgi:hypothetical protein
MDRCPCAPGITCTDIILSDLNMPLVQGLDFVEALALKHCAAPHIALMSGTWSEADEDRAARLGCRVFRKPFSLVAIDPWLAKVATLVSPDRGLLPWDTCSGGVADPCPRRSPIAPADCKKAPRGPLPALAPNDRMG